MYTDHTEYEIEQADEQLQLIVDYKNDLRNYLNTYRSSLKNGAVAMTPAFEEAFDEAFYKQWRRLTEISGSIDWPAEIPSFEFLSFETPHQKAEKRWKSAQRLSAAEILISVPNPEAAKGLRVSGLMRTMEGSL